jgi:hypothetical protein
MKARFILIFACVLAFSATQASVKANPVNFKGDPDTLLAFYNSMKLRDDGDYGKLMNNCKHPAGRLAPEIFRDFIEAMEPQRIYFSQGVDFSDGVISFWWNCNEIGIKGPADSLMKATDMFLTGNDFTLQESMSNTSLRVYQYVQGTRIYQFTIADTVKNRQKGMTTFTSQLKVMLTTYINAPLTSDMLKLYPAIRCADLPTGIFNVIRKQTFRSIAFGGTWERYYTWEVRLPFPTEDALSEVRKKLISAILDYGFVFFNENEGITVFKIQLTETNSYIYLSKPDDFTLKFRFQANS